MYILHYIYINYSYSLLNLYNIYCLLLIIDYFYVPDYK